MDQKPVPGQPALQPPDADIAQRYLDEARSVPARRDRAVDRRSLAWLQIANAVICAVYLTVFALVIRSEGAPASQVLLFTFLVWGQLASGMAQRNGLQWRLTRSRWPIIVGGAAVLVSALIVFGFAVWDPTLPLFVSVVPGALVLVGLGGYGVVQLLRAPQEGHRPRPRRVPLSRETRGGTVLVGIAIGSLILLGAAPEGVVKAVLLLLICLLLVVWLLAARSGLGLPAIGASWRWPHVVAFAVAAAALLVLVLLGGQQPQVLASVLAGAGVVVLFLAVAYVPGRDLRD